MSPDRTPRSRTRKPRASARGPVRAYLDSFVAAIAAVDDRQLDNCLEAIWAAWQGEHTVFLIGNGGSASTASHIANDLSKQAHVPGLKPLRAHALTDSVESMTAVANDTGFENIFAAQLVTHARPGDVLIVVSCSGNSPNLVRAIETARRIGVTTIALGGFDGGRTRDMCDLYVHVPSDGYGVVETAHLLFGHLFAELLKVAARASRRPAVLVDRDGVLLKNRADYVKSLDEMELLPGALDSLVRLSQRGHRIFVVTNQSAIGRGLTTHAHVDSIHAHLASEVRHRGGEIEAFLVCPHTPEEGCECRKPAPGLLLQARDRYGVDLDTAVFVGDWETDIQAAKAAGATSVLVMTGRTRRRSRNGADHTVGNISEAVDLILARDGAH